MEDKEFFDRALQLEAPWFVRSVKLDLQQKKVELEIGVEKGWRWKNSEGRAALSPALRRGQKAIDRLHSDY